MLVHFELQKAVPEIKFGKYWETPLSDVKGKNS